MKILVGIITSLHSEMYTPSRQRPQTPWATRHRAASKSIIKDVRAGCHVGYCKVYSQF